MAQYKIKLKAQTTKYYDDLARYSFNYRLWQKKWEASLSSHDQKEMENWKELLDNWLIVTGKQIGRAHV